MANAESEVVGPGFLLGAGLVIAGTGLNVANVADPLGFLVVLLGAAVIVEALLRGD